jgi:hypothetical protein
MKYLRPLLLLALAAALCAGKTEADTFTLTDSSGPATFGPYDFIHGQEIHLDGRTFVLSIQPSGPSIAEQRAREIILPAVEMRQASLIDAVAYFREASVAVAGPDAVPNLVVDVSEPVPVTLNLRRISLYDALTFTAEVAGCHIRWEDNHVVVSNRK